MNCKTLQNINTICEYSAAGVTELYIANWDADVAISSTNVVLGSGEQFYKIEVPQGTASYTDELAVNGAARSKVHTVNFSISKVTPELSEMIDTLGLGHFVVIALNADAQYVALGSHNGLQATSLVNASGQATTDEKGISVSLSASETASAVILGPQGVQAFKALIHED